MTDVVLVAIIGVAGTLIGSLTGLISAKIADSSRAKNDNKLYISKTQYDLEFGIYRELSKKAFSLIVDLSIIYTTLHIYWQLSFLLYSHHIAFFLYMPQLRYYQTYTWLLFTPCGAHSNWICPLELPSAMGQIHILMPYIFSRSAQQVRRTE